MQLIFIETLKTIQLKKAIKIKNRIFLIHTRRRLYFLVFDMSSDKILSIFFKTQYLIYFNFYFQLPLIFNSFSDLITYILLQRVFKSNSKIKNSQGFFVIIFNQTRVSLNNRDVLDPLVNLKYIFIYQFPKINFTASFNQYFSPFSIK